MSLTHPLLPSRQCFPHPQGQAPCGHTDFVVHHGYCPVSRLYLPRAPHPHNTQNYLIHFSRHPVHLCASHNLPDSGSGNQYYPFLFSAYMQLLHRFLRFADCLPVRMYHLHNTLGSPDCFPVYTQILHNTVHFPDYPPVYKCRLHSMAHLPDYPPACMHRPHNMTYFLRCLPVCRCHLHSMAHLPNRFPAYMHLPHNKTRLPPRFVHY